MNFNQLIDIFLKIESDLDLFNKKIQSIDFWQNVRFRIYLEIQHKTGFYEKKFDKSNFNFYQCIKIFLSLCKNSLTKNPFSLKGKKDILFFGFPRRKKGTNGKFYNIYLDEIIKKGNWNYLYLEEPLHIKPPETKKILYLDNIFLIENIVKKFTKINFSKEELILIKNIENSINKSFNINIDLKNLINDELMTRKIYIHYLKKIIKKYSPKIVIEVPSYHKIIRSLNEVCKELQVPVIEIQHGTIDRIAHGYPKKLKNKIKIFPNYIFTFSEFWNNEVDFPIDKSHLIPVGFNYLETEIKKYATTKKDEKKILFLSQGSIGSQLSKIASELKKILPSDFKIIYKLHPEEYNKWKELYPWLKDIEVIDSNNTSIYKLFSQSIMQVGVSSTALYEGLEMGLKTIIMDLPGYEYLKLLINENYAELCNTAQDIKRILDNQDLKVKKGKAGILFKRNALENVVDEIDIILNKN